MFLFQDIVTLTHDSMAKMCKEKKLLFRHAEKVVAFSSICEANSLLAPHFKLNFFKIPVCFLTMSKAIALLSGGIDSPVAIYLLQSQLDIIAVHFHQQPLTDEKEIEKVKALATVLKIRKLYLIPFTPVLKELVTNCNHRDYFVLSKIAMFKTAEIIAAKEKADYLITGENLGQVSSQTLSNMTSITKNLSLEVLRPLLTFDKQETIEIAKKIGTYEISEGPEMCCLLGPKRPSTKSDSRKIGEELESVPLQKLLEESLNKAEVFWQ